MQIDDTPIKDCGLVGGIFWAFGHMPAFAAGSDDERSTKVTNPDYTAGKSAFAIRQYERAIASFERVVAVESKNADAMTYLGYRDRKLNDSDASLIWYQRTLAVNPDHRGANDDLGELYLQMDDMLEAEAQLERLDDICFFGCDEYDQLKEAIAAHKTGRSVTKAPSW